MLIAYQVALEVITELRPLVERIRKHDNNLAKQLVDAMNSTVQNLAEAEMHRAGNKRVKFEIAHGEANEVKASLDVALAWGYIVDDTAARAKLRRPDLTAPHTSRVARSPLLIRASRSACA